MKNFVFISPNYPDNYWQFCRALKQRGLRVLGIGDAARESLRPELQQSLDDYVQVSTLHSYEAVYKAVAGFVAAYGPLDWLESNNEYWLEQDAKLRTAFGIESGFSSADMPPIRRKSLMKAYYQRAGIPVPRCRPVDDLKSCLAFAHEVDYPLVIKPDNGHGITDACKIKNDAELEAFLSRCDPDTPWLMEEFVRGEVNSYDAILDEFGEPLYETGMVTPMSIMDIVSNNDNAIYYVVDQLRQDVREAGRAVARSFDVRSRFVHFEFFRLTQDHPGLGSEGQIVALEVGMCPCGGHALDMMNYAASVDVYAIWADMICGSMAAVQPGKPAYCAFVGRKAGRRFLIGHDRLCTKYANQLKLAESDESSRYIGLFEDRDRMDAFYTDALWCE
ncbi:MAG: carbamoylphosphate synthase large subunit [Clostridiales bacterium]|nr:carbamoylphosphate synthase large subunit [Clostridiales bacterium]